MDEQKEALKALAEGVSDAYPDFVSAVVSVARHIERGYDLLIAYITEHKEATTSEVLDYVADLRGIKSYN